MTTPREQVENHWPFVVPEHHMGDEYVLLREHGEYMATGGRGMPEDQLGRLRGFYADLKDRVVEYTPEGWAYRERRLDDEDLLIRVNEHTRMTEEGRMIWAFPPGQPGDV